MKKDLASKVAMLQGHVDSMKPFVQKAKEHFKADRKSIRENYKACKKRIRRDKKTYKTSWQCSPFAAHFSSFLEVQEKVDEVTVVMTNRTAEEDDGDEVKMEEDDDE